MLSASLNKTFPSFLPSFIHSFPRSLFQIYIWSLKDNDLSGVALNIHSFIHSFPRSLFQIYIWSLKDNDLSGVAFIDTHIYIQMLNVVKNLILAGDLLKSITVYRFQEALRVLSIVSRVSTGGVGSTGERDVAPWCGGSSDRSIVVDPLSYFWFLLMLHDWCNKCYPVDGDDAYKRTLVANWKE